MRNSLTDYHRMYEKIMSTMQPGVEQDKALSALMDDIQRKYGIPLIQDLLWEGKNKAVAALYRMASESRTTV